MGAANVAKVYQAWSHLDDRPFRLLAYMALRARDHDAAPWYGAGHDELATIGLGLPTGSEKERALSYRIVRRAMTALRRAGAVETTGAAVPGKQARYRLWLDGPPLSTLTEVTERPVNNHPQTLVDNPLTEVTERPVNELFTGHSVDERRSLSGHTEVTERPPEEEEEEEERRTSKANLRNGELWKAGPLDAAEPSGEQMSQNGHNPATFDAAAWRAAARRAIDAAQDAS